MICSFFIVKSLESRVESEKLKMKNEELKVKELRITAKLL